MGELRNKFISVDIGMRSFTVVMMDTYGDWDKCQINRILTWDLSCPQGIKKEKAGLMAIVQRLRGHLQEIGDDVWRESRVLIEKQVGKFSFAQLEAACYMFAMEKKPLQILTVDPRLKLSVNLGGEITKIHAKRYDQNKHYATAQLDALLAKTTQRPLPVIPIKRKKDIADCILQALAIDSNPAFLIQTEPL